MGEAALAAGALVGEYRVEGKLADGGMGSVYAAVHPVIGKRAAIKVMSRALCSDDQAVARFIQEARAANQIGHPNIVDIFSIGELEDGRSYLVMEWLKGASLADQLEREPFDIYDIVAILDQIADAVAAAHAARIVHRDLKPDNVMLVDVSSERSLVKIVDFGIAKLANPEEEGFDSRTKTGFVMGTPGYISPEQARGKNVDHRTDIYSLGCVAFEMLTSRLPYVADNATDIVVQHLHAAIPSARELRAEVPAALDEMVASLMAKEAESRPSLAELRSVLADVAARISGGRASRFASARLARLATATPIPQMARVEAPSEPIPPSAGTALPTMMVDREAETAGKSRAFVAVLAIFLVAAAAVVGFVMTRGGDDPASSAAPAAAAQSDEPAGAEPAPAPSAAAVPSVELAPPPSAEPVAPAATAPESARVVVKVNARNARIELDGEVIAARATRAAVEVSPGKHVLVVSAAGYRSLERTIEVAAGGEFEVNADLRRLRAGKAPKKGRAKVKPGKSGKAEKPGPKKKDRDFTMDPFAN